MNLRPRPDPPGDGGPTTDVDIRTPTRHLHGTLHGDQTVQITVNGHPSIGINAAGDVGWWPDQDTFVELLLAPVPHLVETVVCTLTDPPD